MWDLNHDQKRRNHQTQRSLEKRTQETAPLYLRPQVGCQIPFASKDYADPFQFRRKTENFALVLVQIFPQARYFSTVLYSELGYAVVETLSYLAEILR